MGWDDRQRALLAELGVRFWVDPRPGGDPGDPLGPDRPSETGSDPRLDASRVSSRQSDRSLPDLPSTREAAQAVTSSGRQPAGIEAMEWPALRAAVAGCTACGLCHGRRNTVFGAGSPGAHWMIVGEAPGEQEDRQGEPFVGKAGQLLDNMLRALGLHRDAGSAEGGEAAASAATGDAAQRVVLANVLKCRPPMNRNPLPEEVAQCEPYLRRQVSLVRPRMILAMGRFAVQSLLRSDLPIGKLRGRLHAYEGVPLVVTYHPAYLLRNPADKARAWDDLCLARSALRAADPVPGTPRSGD
ncbi:uracil-DNA glycosylase [Methylibium sp.]|uniref:uracil-DNA glycosylase n=1 Tax=Methylibium sp. TaxID=2067992 RepID=UPI0017B85ADF|nr:uracil-DNA glycosylase [Methylibium sp.]MBA3588072.1 uracil-DNA glycosylase [Methylibium sp.]